MIKHRGTPSTDIGRSLVYNEYYTPVADAFLSSRFSDYDELSPIQKAIFRMYVNQKKICGSYSLVMKLINGESGGGNFVDAEGNHIVVTRDDVDRAYAAGAGGGCEYEWPYE